MQLPRPTKVSATEIFTDESGKFWGSAGAGGLFYAEDTGRVLVQRRSAHVNEPNTWGVWGGAIDADENPKDALRREIKEESGFNGRFALDLVYVFKSGNFRFHNFLIVVPQEFEPRHGWESSGHVWADIDDLPSPLHFGLKAALPSFRRAIEARQKVSSRVSSALRAAADAIVSARDLGRRDTKKFYVVIPLGNEGQGLKAAKDLSRGVLDGVQGISETANIIMHWYNIGRNAILAMDARKLVSLNKLSRVQYENPQYLASNGLAALYRIWDKNPETTDGHRGVTANLLKEMGTARARTGASPVRKGLEEARSALKDAVATISKGTSGLDPDVLRDIEDNLSYLEVKNLRKWAEEVEARVTDLLADDDRGLMAFLPNALARIEDNAPRFRRHVKDALEKESDVREWVSYQDPEYAPAFEAILAGLKKYVAAIEAFTEMPKLLEREKSKGSKASTLAYSLNHDSWYFNKAFTDYLSSNRKDIQTVQGLADRLYRAWTRSDDPKVRRTAEEAGKDTVLSMVRSALEGIGSTYKGEGEWLVKDRKLKVPPGSILYVSSVVPEGLQQRRADGSLTEIDKAVHHYALNKQVEMEETIEQYRLDKKYKVIFVDDKKFDAARMKWYGREKKAPVNAALSDWRGQWRLLSDLDKVFDEADALAASAQSQGMDYAQRIKIAAALRSAATTLCAELPKDEWTRFNVGDLRQDPDLLQEVFDLVKTAYKPIGGHAKIKTPADLLAEATFFDVIDVDEDPDPDAVLLTEKKSPGEKGTGMGHDGSRLAKDEALKHKGQSLKKQGVYAEVSGPLAHVLLTKFGVPVVNDEATVRKVLKKEIEWVGPNPDKPSYPPAWYFRDIGGTRHLKILVGRPRA